MYVVGGFKIHFNWLVYVSCSLLKCLLANYNSLMAARSTLRHVHALGKGMPKLTKACSMRAYHHPYESKLVKTQSCSRF